MLLCLKVIETDELQKKQIGIVKLLKNQKEVRGFLFISLF